MAFQQGLSGLNAASKQLDVIGNNISNTSTVGFKGAQAQFADVFANSLAGGASTAQVGFGTKVAAVEQQFTQGNITTSNNPLDIAINGQGFFRMSGNGALTYTRNGQFQLEKNGFIVDAAGNRLTGYQAQNGKVVPGVMGDLRLSTSDLLPKATADVGVGANLSSADAVKATAAFNPTDPASFNFSTATTLFDSLGQSHVMTLYFNKTAANTWDVNTYLDGAAANGAGVSALSFNADGSYAAATNPTKSAVLTNGAAPLAFDLDFKAVTQFGSVSGVSSLTQDGYTSGRLNGFNVSKDGLVLGRYTNGQAQALGQVALANFNSPTGLQPLGNNQWAETADSGPPLVGTPDSGTLGVLQSAAVEDSNVDLAAELVNLITAQRYYQANAQTIKTQDQVLQTLVNLR